MGIRDTINRIRARHSIISPWPWFPTSQGFCNDAGDHIVAPYDELDICTEDSEFIAHAPEDIENLLEMWENVCAILLSDHPTSYDQLAALYEAVGLGWNDVLEYRRPSRSGIQPERREALVVRPFGRSCPQGAIALDDDGDVWVKEFNYAYNPKPWVMFRHEDGEIAGGRYTANVLAKLNVEVIAGIRRGEPRTQESKSVIGSKVILDDDRAYPVGSIALDNHRDVWVKCEQTWRCYSHQGGGLYAEPRISGAGVAQSYDAVIVA